MNKLESESESEQKNKHYKWKGDHQISPSRHFRHLIMTSMFSVHYTCYTFFIAFKKNDSVPTPAIEAFRFWFRFRPQKFQCSDSEIMETVTSDSDYDWKPVPGRSLTQSQDILKCQNILIPKDRITGGYIYIAEMTAVNRPLHYYIITIYISREKFWIYQNYREHFRIIPELLPGIPKLYRSAYWQNILLFDNKIKMASKPGKKQQGNRVGCTGEGKRWQRDIRKGYLVNKISPEIHLDLYSLSIKTLLVLDYL